jgi:hypothetical protein
VAGFEGAKDAGTNFFFFLSERISTMKALEQWTDQYIQRIQQTLRGLQQHNPATYEAQRGMWEEAIIRAHAWVESERYWRFVYRPSC